MLKKEIFEDEINFKREINELIEIDIRSCNAVNLYDFFVVIKIYFVKKLRKKLKFKK